MTIIETLSKLIGINNWAEMSQLDVQKTYRGVLKLYIQPTETGLNLAWSRTDGSWIAYREYGQKSIRKITMETLYDPKYRNTITRNEILTIMEASKKIISLEDIIYYQSQETNNLTSQESNEPVSPFSQSYINNRQEPNVLL